MQYREIRCRKSVSMALRAAGSVCHCERREHLAVSQHDPAPVPSRVVSKLTYIQL